MKDRIKKIMDNEDLTPARFADNLQINRAVISHILNGRNNPSLDVVMKILSEMDYINSDWLLNGNGPMYREGYLPSKNQSKQSLFDVDATEVDSPQDVSKYSKEKQVEHTKIASNSIENQYVGASINVNRRIKEIIIYYTDNTFESFIPH